MKHTFLTMRRQSAAAFIFSAFLISGTFNACRKDGRHDDTNKPSQHNAEVLDKWMTLQLRLMRNATGIPNQGFARHFAYTGIAALESLKPFQEYSAWTKKWNGLTGLPVPAKGLTYYYPANVNAAMASINKSMFPDAGNADKQAIDSLEDALNQKFLAKQPAAVVNASAAFGKAIAQAVFNWAEADGYKNANAPYTLPSGTGMWVPTPPSFASAATPYWGNIRPAIAGSLENTDATPPPTYSTAPGSPFYEMVRKVYDASKVLTDDQKAMAVFWRDVPGATSPGHWLSIVQQMVQQKGSTLDAAAVAYALTGVAIHDGLICCFKTKYKYNVVRPVTYIREVMGHTTWNSLLTTPAHPEYISAHSNLSGAAAAILEKLFGNAGSFTDHTYDYLGFAPRTYTSFSAIAEEAGNSRLYAGIHYELSISEGLKQGRKVAANIMQAR